MKKLSALLAVLLCLGLLAGCMGTPVIYHEDCDCPTESTENKPADSSETVPAGEGELKTGLALITTMADSKHAADGENGEGKYDVTMVAVLVDGEGVIRDCIIDGVSASVNFDAAGAITSDLSAPVKTKNELGENYGMVAWGGAVAEWDAQAAALASFAVGKTPEELRKGAIDETGKAPAGSDLASSATIYLGGYVSAIEEACANAKNLGAQSGDSLHMAAISSIDGSKSATSDKEGLTQLEVTATALSMKDGIITSCLIDSVQAKVSFDASGTVTSDVSVPAPTKTQLGESYGMVAWGGAIAEWDIQAASFAAYVTGKTPAEVSGIAVNEGTVPTEADLSSSVTIAIGGFQALIQKAAQ